MTVGLPEGPVAGAAGTGSAIVPLGGALVDVAVGLVGAVLEEPVRSVVGDAELLDAGWDDAVGRRLGGTTPVAISAVPPGRLVSPAIRADVAYVLLTLTSRSAWLPLLTSTALSGRAAPAG
jgi:hypothetical protein